MQIGRRKMGIRPRSYVRGKREGFTFIEVMIAIAVFSIGVLAVLNLIMHNLAAIDKSQTKITATMLAKEGIELAYNLRDSNLEKGLPRNCASFDVAEDVCASYLGSGQNIWQVAFSPDEYYVFEAAENTGFEENILHYSTGNEIFWYGYESGDETSYARYLLFTGIVDGNTLLPTDNMLKIESHVLYRRGSAQGDLVLESIIGNF